jgi:hypothetical protein
MTKFRRRCPAPETPELETVTDYRMIALGGGLLLAFLAIPLAAALFTGSHASPPPAVAAVKTPQPAPAESATPAPRVAPIRPQFSFPLPEPYRPRKAPAPPPPAVATSVPGVKPPPVAASLARADEQAPDAAAAALAAVAAHGKTSFHEPPGFKRRRDKHNATEHELLALLRIDVPEVRLDAEAGTSKQLLAKSGKDHPVLELLARRADLAGLPVRQAAECQASPEAVQTAQALSRDLLLWRRTRARGVQRGASNAEPTDAVPWLARVFDGNARWASADCVSTLEQVLQAEAAPLRSLLVKQLAKIHGPIAGAALARRAVFDLSDGVREEAVDALRQRPLGEARPTLLAAFRYPWEPAADHAAEALVNLGDRAAAAELGKLCDLPDPSAPAFDSGKKKWFVPELVRVNHLSSCLLCHAPSSDPRDLLRSPVPEPGEPLPLIYYSVRKGPAVRQDVTYLRQDFSVPQRVENAVPWPEVQRFDYLVRKRELPAAEVAARAAAVKGLHYPQRDAALFALRELVGDAGVAQ